MPRLQENTSRKGTNGEHEQRSLYTLATKDYIAEEPAEQEANGKSFDVTSSSNAASFFNCAHSSTHACTHACTHAHTDRLAPNWQWFYTRTTPLSVVATQAFLPTCLLAQAALSYVYNYQPMHLSPTTTNDKCLDLAQKK